jgi:predicted outer membrane protein
VALGGGKSGGGASAGAIRAGAAFVEFFGKDRLSPVLDALKAKFNSVGSFLTRIGGAGLAAGTAVLAPVAGLFTAAVERGKDLQLLADRMGTTTEAVSSLAYAFETIGVQADQFADAVKGLQQKLSTAADGQDETFRRLGLNARELMNLPLEDQFARIADALSRVSSPADQARFAMEALGEVGLKVLPALKNGSLDLAELKKEAGDVGATMSGEDARRATEVAKSTAKAWSAIKYAVMEVGMALLPQSGHVKDFAGGVSSLAKRTREWVGENKALVLAVVGVGAGLAAGGAALIGFGLAAKTAGVALGVAAGAVGLVKAAVLALLSPVGLAVAAVGGIAAVFLTQTEAGRAFVADTRAGFEDFAATAKEAWGGVSAALAKGDLGQAARVGLSFVSLEWAKATLFWTEVWNKFKASVVDGWRDLVTMIAGGWAEIGEALDVLPEGTRKTIDAQRGEQQRANEAARRADVEAAKRAVEAARNEFKVEVGGAMQVDWTKIGNEVGAAAAKGIQDAAAAVAKVSAAARGGLADAVKGGFDAAAARQQFGYGDKTAQRSLQAQEKTAAGVAGMVPVLGSIDGTLKTVLTFK